MFLSPLAKRQNSTLKHWQLYRIHLLKWSSWYHFNMEFKAPVIDSSSIWRLYIIYVRTARKATDACQNGKEHVLFTRLLVHI